MAGDAMTKPTANLQPRMTVKQASRLMNVSERTIYMAGVVQRRSPHLAAEVEAGRMNINEAYRLATNKPKPTSWDRLLAAWNNGTEEDRGKLSRFILEVAYDELQATDRRTR